MIKWLTHMEKKGEAEFDYTNYKNETSHRLVVVHAIGFGSSEWHTEPQWMMLALDLEKMEMREFAMRDMKNFSPSRPRDL
jgi:predicted DNA-binding transcriptional regulator YafY